MGLGPVASRNVSSGMRFETSVFRCPRVRRQVTLTGEDLTRGALNGIAAEQRTDHPEAFSSLCFGAS